jgi:hypothetical protein
MAQELQQFTTPVTRPWLYRLLENPAAIPVEPLEHQASLREVRKTVTRLIKKCGDQPLPIHQRSSWDRELVQPLYKALKGLPRRTLVDIRFWHWLCIVPLQDFVWYRWYGQIPEDPRMALNQSQALIGRFTGTSSLNGFSRNALARLYWCAATLYTEEEEFHWVELVLSNQDLYQAIFERKFSLYPPAVRACLIELKDRTEAERREAIKRFNYHLTTIVLETLTEEEIRKVLTL